MKIKTLVLPLFCLLYITIYTQDYVENNIVGKSIIMPSKVMNDERVIQVYLPDGYNDSEKKYPVLYILDGQRYFLHGVSLQKSFVEFKQTPEFIVVGIPRNPSDRNRIYTVNSNQYLRFIQKEIINYMDVHYRTSDERLFFGWAFGGGFVLETLITMPSLFDAFIASSPFPVKNKIPRIDSLLTERPDFNKLVYFSSETSEGSVKEGTYELNTLLKKKGGKGLNWTFKALESEEHRSTPFTTLYHGTAQYFQYFPELQFNSLEDFLNAGGLEYVHKYYQKRASKYGFPEQPSDWTMFSITRNAIRASDFKQFDALVSEFGKTNFLERLRLNRACAIAEFYLENQGFEKALELFSLLSEKHPDSERPLNGLGNTYKAMGETKKANLYYRKAKKLSQNQEDY